ncbi:MAG: hypothetical protein CMM61_00550 [Rhodospirillaceae bacterium]|nr:hypothetical protein [Rhodospirillaceae bacterium]
MSIYWVSFRIDHTGNYQYRYDALVEGIRGLAARFWEETTSFIVLETAASIDTLAADALSAIDPNNDVVLVRNMDSKSARVIGLVEDDDIYVLMPYLKYVE